MSKLSEDLTHQLSIDESDDTKECLTLYDIILITTGHVWESQWDALTKCEFIGVYPKTKKFYKLNELGKLVIKGYNS